MSNSGEAESDAPIDNPLDVPKGAASPILELPNELENENNRRRRNRRRSIVPPPGLNENLLPRDRAQQNQEDLIHLIRNLNREIQGIRESTDTTQRVVAQLQNEFAQIRHETDQEPEEDLVLQRELQDQNQRRRPNLENRRSIRLIKETSRIASMRFDGNVVKCNPSKLIRELEENASLEGLNEREKLTVFKSIMKGEASAWIESVEAENYQSIKN